jgi:enoyl-[acyl-carrier protein] reductase I
MQQKNALVVGIRNADSVCTAIAQEMKRTGYHIYATYQDESTREGVSEVAERIGVEALWPYDARKDEDIDRLAETIRSAGVQFDALIHGISYSTAQGAKLHLPLVDVTWEEFTDAIRVGAFSLVDLSGRLLDNLKEDASLLTITLHWSQFAVPGMNVVGAAKAALESLVRGLAESLGKAKGIRVNAVSPGYLPTYSLSLIGNRLDILERAKDRSPLKATTRMEDVATLAVSLIENRSITGTVYPIDTGAAIMGSV